VSLAGPGKNLWDHNPLGVNTLQVLCGIKSASITRVGSAPQTGDIYYFILWPQGLELEKWGGRTATVALASTTTSITLDTPSASNARHPWCALGIGQDTRGHEMGQPSLPSQPAVGEGYKE
jgi:hypothetical protein